MALLQMYEAAMAKLQLAGATKHALATVSRLQPDRSIYVRALTGLGRVRTLWVESIRLEFSKVCALMHVEVVYHLCSSSWASIVGASNNQVHIEMHFSRTNAR